MSRKDDGGGTASAVSVFEVIADADGFREAAMFVFGNYGWHRQVANALGKDESTVHRWINEQTEIPWYARSALAAWKIVFEATGQRPPEEPGMRARQQQKLDRNRADKASRKPVDG